MDAARRSMGVPPASRESASIARAVIENLIPDAAARLAGVGIFAELVERAHELGASRWSISLFDRGLRLNVGGVPPVDIATGCVALLLDRDLLGPELRNALGVRITSVDDFELVQRTVLACLPAEEIADWWPRLREPSLAMVRQAGQRDTSFWRSHSPGVLRYLEEELGRTMPTPTTRTAVVDIDEVLARTQVHLTPQRIDTRTGAMTKARELIQAHVRTLTVEDLTRLLKLFCLDYYRGGEKGGRFGMALTGSLRKQIIENLDLANHWIAAIWSAGSDADLARALNELGSQPLPGAGWSLPSLVAHAKAPALYFPCTSSGVLWRGIRELVGVRVVDGSSYVEACTRLRQLCTERGLSPHGVDIAAYQANELADASRRAVAPTPPPTVAPAAAASPASQHYDRAAFLAETSLEEDDLDDIEALLEDKSQLVLHGPPGTGKTWIAERLARYLAGPEGLVRTVQFHPSYGYEDFIEGIRPVVDETGTRITYPVERGIFRRLCDEAKQRPAPCVLVVDEINRGNLPRIFGELLFLLERREQPIELPLSREQMVVPANVVVIGTMNTADQSIALLDMALRRRFHFKRLDPSEDALRGWLRDNALALIGVADALRALNELLRADGVDRDRWIGHSHFMRPGIDDEKLRRIWLHSVMPTVEELLHGKRDLLARYDYETLVAPRLARAEFQEERAEEQT